MPLLNTLNSVPSSEHGVTVRIGPRNKAIDNRPEDMPERFHRLIVHSPVSGQGENGIGIAAFSCYARA
jgi:hypothetical protein